MHGADREVGAPNLGHSFTKQMRYMLATQQLPITEEIINYPNDTPHCPRVAFIISLNWRAIDAHRLLRRAGPDRGVTPPPVSSPRTPTSAVANARASTWLPHRIHLVTSRLDQGPRVHSPVGTPRDPHAIGRGRLGKQGRLAGSGATHTAGEAVDPFEGQSHSLNRID